MEMAEKLAFIWGRHGFIVGLNDSMIEYSMDVPSQGNNGFLKQPFGLPLEYWGTTQDIEKQAVSLMRDPVKAAQGVINARNLVANQDGIFDQITKFATEFGEFKGGSYRYYLAYPGGHVRVSLRKDSLLVANCIQGINFEIKKVVDLVDTRHGYIKPDPKLGMLLQECNATKKGESDDLQWLMKLL